MEARTWDVLVIGAGPSGTMAARCAALSGLKTLLVDSKPFPRDKVCGGYLNTRALRALASSGLQSVVGKNNEPSSLTLRLLYNRHDVIFPLPPGQIVCRRWFDNELLDAARNAGAEVMLQSYATVHAAKQDGIRHIELIRNGERKLATARTVICADGLARPSVRHLPHFATVRSAESRVGIGATALGDQGAIPPGQLLMAISARGYVGVSQITQNQFNVAAAIDPQELSRKSALEVVRAMLQESNVDIRVDLDNATWRGTVPLTSRPLNVAADGVFLIGDAGGYVEPFTGEGMAAALETGAAVTPFVAQAATKWSQVLSESWTSTHRQLVYERQSTCRQLAWILRRPWASLAAFRLCQFCPTVARLLIARTSY